MTIDPKIKIDRKKYADKVYSCWVGKNIGGTMGAPFEGTHDILDIKGYTTDENVVLPNDDLDLQLVWLLAVERLGAHAIDAHTLGEFWLSYIPPNWNEYGIGKNNLTRGLVPPLSGDYENDWKHSNGAWIRTEVWACMAPGCPDIAARYAIEDAKVDHGAGEGTYAAAFVAAMQAAAFVLDDLRPCIEIGLSMIPEHTRMADTVRFVIECYEKGIPAMETRNLVQARNADIGNGWFEAPSNVAYALIGLLYGEGDFKKTMITAINCGDDTDCTAATVGATLGILKGSAAIPADWQRHIGDDIVTISINRGGVAGTVPKTCTELAERVMNEAPHMLHYNDACVAISDEEMIPEGVYELIKNHRNISKHALTWTTGEELKRLKPYTMHHESHFLVADTVLSGAPDVKPGDEITVEVNLRNFEYAYDSRYYQLNMRWWLPEGFSVEGKQSAVLDKGTRHNAYQPCTTLTYKLRAGESVCPENRCVLEITAVGRTTSLYIPITLLG